MRRVAGEPQGVGSDFSRRVATGTTKGKQRADNQRGPNGFNAVNPNGHHWKSADSASVDTTVTIGRAPDARFYSGYGDSFSL